jgi:hypothetical protein
VYRVGVHFFPMGLVIGETRTATVRVFRFGEEIFADISPGVPLSRAGLVEGQFWYAGYLTVTADSATFVAVGSLCGDLSIDEGETCDGTNLGGLDCTDFGYSGGTLDCVTTCDATDPSGCTP